VIFKLSLPSVGKKHSAKSSLPSVVPLPSVKKDTRQRNSLPSVKNKTLGKELIRRVFSFIEGFLCGTRQRVCRVPEKTLGKEYGARQRAKFR
jgi:hypothetical protein